MKPLEPVSTVDNPWPGTRWSDLMGKLARVFVNIVFKIISTIS